MTAEIREAIRAEALMRGFDAVGFAEARLAVEGGCGCVREAGQGAARPPVDRYAGVDAHCSGQGACVDVGLLGGEVPSHGGVGLQVPQPRTEEVLQGQGVVDAGVTVEDDR